MEDQSVLLSDSCSFDEPNSADLLSPVYSQGSEKFIQKFPLRAPGVRQGLRSPQGPDTAYENPPRGLAPKNLTPIPVEAPAKPTSPDSRVRTLLLPHEGPPQATSDSAMPVPLVPVETEDLSAAARGSVRAQEGLIPAQAYLPQGQHSIPSIPTPVHYTDAELKKIRHELKLEVEEGGGGCHCQRLDSTVPANIMQSLGSSASMAGIYDTTHVLMAGSEALTLVSPAQVASGSNPIPQQVSSSSPRDSHMTSGMLMESADLDSYSSSISGNSVAIVHPAAVYSYPYGASAPVAAYSYVDAQAAGLQQQDAGGQYDDATTAAVLSALASTGNVSQLQNMMNQLLQ
eukprot:Em0020g936a